MVRLPCVTPFQRPTANVMHGACDFARSSDAPPAAVSHRRARFSRRRRRRLPRKDQTAPRLPHRQLCWHRRAHTPCSASAASAALCSTMTAAPPHPRRIPCKTPPLRANATAHPPPVQAPTGYVSHDMHSDDCISTHPCGVSRPRVRASYRHLNGGLAPHISPGSAHPLHAPAADYVFPIPCDMRGPD